MVHSTVPTPCILHIPFHHVSTLPQTRTCIHHAHMLSHNKPQCSILAILPTEIEMLLHDAVRDGVGQAERQQRGLPAAGRTIPDLLIHMNGQVFLCDVTVADTLADSNLATAATGPARLAKEAARGKVDKYKLAADAMRAVHLPFAVETMGGLSESAQQLIREIHHSAGDHNTWRDAAIIGTHLVDAVAIAVQRCTGMALQKSQWRERQVAMGAQAA